MTVSAAVTAALAARKIQYQNDLLNVTTTYQAQKQSISNLLKNSLAACKTSNTVEKLAAMSALDNVYKSDIAARNAKYAADKAALSTTEANNLANCESTNNDNYGKQLNDLLTAFDTSKTNLQTVYEADIVNIKAPPTV